MILETIPGFSYLKELAMQQDVCRHAKDAPEKALGLISDMKIARIRDSSIKKFCDRAKTTDDRYIEIIKTIEDPAIRSKAAKRLHDKTASSSLKQQLAALFDFTIADAKARQKQEADTLTLKKIAESEDAAEDARLFAELRTSTSILSGKMKIFDKNLVTFDFPYDRPRLKREVKTTITALSSLAQLPASKVKQFISRLKRQFRLLDAFEMKEEHTALKNACSEKQIDGRWV